MAVERATKRKRVKLAEGDVFEFVLPNGQFGYGIIVKCGRLKNGGTPYIAMFGSLHRERPDLAKLLGEKVALAGWTMDGHVYRGQWNVIAHGSPLPFVPYPNFKVKIGDKYYVTDVSGPPIREATDSETELLDYQFSKTPMCFHHAFEALHGFSEWNASDDKLTPAYAKARVLL